MATSLPILTFHALDDQRSVISFSPELFRRGMAKLFENGYRTIRLLEAVDYLRLRKPFPERSFVITFDDGYESVYEEAFPVLQAYRMTVTIFLTVGERGRVNPGERLPLLEGRSMLDWREIQEMKQWGIEFGAHTLTHPDLTRLSLERVRSEICNSKVIIEDALNAPVECFAAPYSRYDDRSLEIIRQHFTCACSDKLSLITLKSDLYGLERIDTYYLRTERLFDIMLTPLFPWYVRVRSIPRGIRRFVQKGLR
jgi:peptidoglycan/xylan/chitin deacetylase (PgdA/CDA1 family)